ncbi:SLC13 family permease [Hoylesella shahii]|uniref:TrkA family protein n=1 Tax=Hoylesella shahii DSM 15611 = JCM 12083 TaxID=1122991 RepID=A0A318I890_9BACT|nr:SLC13 family permease [Hoylesella shahii]PXX21211.1 TrkA family protein [Hoylesella shahii DSM 15611 = JCM 12083]
MITTLVILAISVTMFIIGRVRSDVVAVCAMAALLIFGILTPAEALAGFSSTVVIMMVGLFVVGGAIFQTGLAKAASHRIMALAGGNDTFMFLLVMFATAIIGAFVSNTGTIALMMPVVVSVATQKGMHPGRMLMPLAFASSMGGMLTLIGTPPNLVIQEALTQAGETPLTFFSFTPVGLIIVVIGVLLMLPLSRMFLGKRKQKDGDAANKGKTLDQLVEEYNLQHQLRRYHITPQSPITGQTLAELDLRNRFGVSVMEIRRKAARSGRFIRNVKQSMPMPDSMMQAEDIIYISGDNEQMDRFAKDMKLEQLDDTGIDFYDLGIAELVLMPTSQLNGARLKTSGLREHYNVNVLGIRRSHNYILNDLSEEKLHAGDVLLVQGSWTNIGQLAGENEDWVVLGQPKEQAQKVILTNKAPIAGAIMVLMVAMMMFDFIPIAPVTAVIIAGLLMVLTGCFRNVEAAYKTINWESVVLIAAMMPMSTALEKTGVSAQISHTLVNSLGSMSPLVLLAGIYITTSVMTMFISNTATAVLMAPIALSAAKEIHASPYAFLFAVTIAASMCFMSPFSTPPNALVMRAGQYTFMDYVKVGFPLQLVIGVVMVFLLPIIFPV